MLSLSTASAAVRVFHDSIQVTVTHRQNLLNSTLLCILLPASAYIAQSLPHFLRNVHLLPLMHLPKWLRIWPESSCLCYFSHHRLLPSQRREGKVSNQYDSKTLQHQISHHVRFRSWSPLQAEKCAVLVVESEGFAWERHFPAKRRHLVNSKDTQVGVGRMVMNVVLGLM